MSIGTFWRKSDNKFLVFKIETNNNKMDGHLHCVFYCFVLLQLEGYFIDVYFIDVKYKP